MIALSIAELIVVGVLLLFFPTLFSVLLNKMHLLDFKMTHHLQLYSKLQSNSKMKRITQLMMNQRLGRKMFSIVLVKYCFKWHPQMHLLD